MAGWMNGLRWDGTPVTTGGVRSNLIAVYSKPKFIFGLLKDQIYCRHDTTPMLLYTVLFGT